MLRSLAAWLWFVELRRGGSALDASDEIIGELAASLMGHFAAVHVMRGDAAELESLRANSAHEGWTPSSLSIGTIQTASWPAGTFDCIALHDSLARKELGNRIEARPLKYSTKYYI